MVEKMILYFIVYIIISKSKSKSEKTRADQLGSSLVEERMGREEPQAVEHCVHTRYIVTWTVHTLHCINLHTVPFCGSVLGWYSTVPF